MWIKGERSWSIQTLDYTYPMRTISTSSLPLETGTNHRRLAPGSRTRRYKPGGKNGKTRSTLGMNIAAPNTSNECSECPPGKGTRVSHPSSGRAKATAVGQNVHTDLIGPITPLSLGGGRYVFLLTEEYSNYRVAYILKRRMKFMTN